MFNSKKFYFLLILLILFINFTNCKIFKSQKEEKIGKYFMVDIIDEDDIFLHKKCKCIKKIYCNERDEIELTK